MERRIRCMVAEGELGRAMRILQQAQIAPGTAETVAALRALHPEDSTPLTAAEAALPQDMPQLALSRTVFDQTVRTLPSFSGHGLDLTRFEHIRSLEQYCPAGHDAFYGLTCLILAGGASVSATLQRMLCAARVVAFAKPHGGVRPLAVGSAWRRAMARALATQRRAVWAELLQPEQMGVGVRGGTEMMVHGTRGLLADHPDLVVVSTDCRNAYNSVSRGAMLRQLFVQDPAVARFVMFFYGQDAELLYGADDGIETIFSRTGSQQGDPLAGLLFSLAIQPVLAQVQATAVGEAEGARVLAQIDDVYLVGPREWAAQAYAQMTAAYAAIDLAMRDDKGRVFSPRGIAVQHTAAARGGVDGGGGGGAALRDMGFGAAGVPVVAHGVRGADGAVSEQAGLVVVGAAVGPLQFQRTHARQAYGDSARLLSLLMVVLMDPQVGCLLVRHCVLTRITYAQRTLLPAAHDGAAEAFDGMTQAAFEGLARTGPLDEHAAALLRLPTRLGGVGWRRAAGAARVAFLASHLQAIDSFCEVSAEWRADMLAVAGRLHTGDDGMPVARPPQHPAEVALLDAHRGVLATLTAPRRHAASYSSDLADNLASTQHLQRRLSRQGALAQRDAVTARLCGRRRRAEAARAPLPRGSAEHAAAGRPVRAARRLQVAWDAAQSDGATTYLLVLPDSTEYGGFVTMTHEVFRITVALHLGTAYRPVVAGGERPLRCPCAGGCADLDPELDVLSACGRGGHAFSHTARHDMWVAVWDAFLRAHGYSITRERQIQAVFGRLSPGTKCPDLLVGLPGGQPLALDGVVRHFCPPGSEQFGTHGALMDAAERAKLREYHPGRGRWPPAHLAVAPRVVPLAASTFGSVGERAMGFFRDVVRESAAGAAFASDAVRYQNLHSGQHAEVWRRRICVWLRICVGTHLLARVRAACDPALADQLRHAERCGFERWRRTQAVVAGVAGCTAALPVELAGAAVGGGYAGDVPRDGILGDGLARLRGACA